MRKWWLEQPLPHSRLDQRWARGTATSLPPSWVRRSRIRPSIGTGANYKPKGLFRTARAAIDELRSEREPEASHDEIVEAMDQMQVTIDEALIDRTVDTIDVTS